MLFGCKRKFVYYLLMIRIRQTEMDCFTLLHNSGIIFFIDSSAANRIYCDLKAFNSAIMRDEKRLRINAIF